MAPRFFMAFVIEDIISSLETRYIKNSLTFWLSSITPMFSISHRDIYVRAALYIINRSR